MGFKQPFPKLDSSLVDEKRNITIPWYRFLISLWTAIGSSYIDPINAIFLQLVSGTIHAFSAETGADLGAIVTTGPGGAAIPQVLGASPFTFVSPGPGFLISSSGIVQMSRNGGATYYLVSLVGGACPVRQNDRVQISWTQAAPAVVYMPDS